MTSPTSRENADLSDGHSRYPLSAWLVSLAFQLNNIANSLGTHGTIARAPSPRLGVFGAPPIRGDPRIIPSVGVANSVWKQENLFARRVTAPATIGELVVVGDLEGYLHWMDKSNGEFVARTQFSKSPIIAPPVAVEDIVYAYSSDGALGAYTSN